MIRKTERAGDCQSPQKLAMAKAIGYGRQVHRVSRSGTHIAPSSLTINNRPMWRGLTHSRAPNRRQYPVMIQLVHHRTIPPSGSGGWEHIRNMTAMSIANNATLHTPVSPVKPASGYIGGKRNLAGRIITRIAAIEHGAYAEPFVGMGGVFLRRTSRPTSETINDWSLDVATFFRILQRHYVAFLDMLRFQLTSRAGFERLLATDPATLTDLERAARFLYLQRVAFGGKVAGRHFGVSPLTAGRFDITKLAPLLEAIHERLSGVVIERLPWADFIKRYDRPSMLFYLDPPYFGTENMYGKTDDGIPLFGREQFAEMASILGSISGQFLLSINDHPAVRKIFAGFAIETVKTTYSVGAKSAPKIVGELIISRAC